MQRSIRHDPAGDSLAWPPEHPLGELTAARLHGNAGRLRCPDHGGFYLLLNGLGAWSLQRPAPLALQPGEGLLLHAEPGLELCFPAPFQLCILGLPQSWLRPRLPAPAPLLNRPIPAHAGWGRALTALAAQLSPELLAQPAMPLARLTEQLGHLLALTADELNATVQAPDHGENHLHQRLRLLIAQRCAEPALSASDIALAANISVRSVHRILARFGDSFTPLLLDARARAALRMLESPLFDRFTAAQISQRAGFKQQSHFTRVMREHFGAPPSELRKQRQVR